METFWTDSGSNVEAAKPTCIGLVPSVVNTKATELAKCRIYNSQLDILCPMGHKVKKSMRMIKWEIQCRTGKKPAGKKTTLDGALVRKYICPTERYCAFFHAVELPTSIKDAIVKNAGKSFVNQPDWSYIDMLSMVRVLGGILSACTFNDELGTKDLLPNGQYDIRGIQTVLSSLSFSTDALYIPRNVDSKGFRCTYLALCLAANMCGSSVVSENIGVNDDRFIVDEHISGVTLWLGCVRALNLLADYYTLLNETDLFAVAYVSGFHSVASVVAHSDEGGCMRDIFRNINYRKPYGAIPPRMSVSLRLPLIGRNTVGGLQSYVDGILLATAATVAHSDPMVEANGMLYPTILSATNRLEIEKVKREKIVYVQQKVEERKGPSDPKLDVAPVCPTPTVSEAGPNRSVPGLASGRDEDNFRYVSIRQEVDETGFTANSKNKLAREMVFKLGEVIGDFARLYAKNLSILLGMIPSDPHERICDLFYGSLTSTRVSKDTSLLKHFCHDVMVPFFWIEPTAIIPPRSYGTRAEAVGNCSFASFGTKGMMRFFEYAEADGYISNHVVDLKVQMTCPRRSGLLTWLHGHELDGMANIQIIQADPNSIGLTCGGMAENRELISNGSSFSEFMWTRGQSPLSHPAEVINTTGSMLIRIQLNIDSTGRVTNRHIPSIADIIKNDNVSFGASRVSRQGDNAANCFSSREVQRRCRAAEMISNILLDLTNQHCDDKSLAAVSFVAPVLKRVIQVGGPVPSGMVGAGSYINAGQPAKAAKIEAVKNTIPERVLDDASVAKGKKIDSRIEYIAETGKKVRATYVDASLNAPGRPQKAAVQGILNPDTKEMGPNTIENQQNDIMKEAELIQHEFSSANTTELTS